MPSIFVVLGPASHKPALGLFEVGGLEVDIVSESALGVDRETCAGLREQGQVHHAVADREDLVLSDAPLRGQFPDDLPLSPWVDVDRYETREDPVFVLEVIAERGVRVEEREGGIGDFAGSPRDQNDPC